MAWTCSNSLGSMWANIGAINPMPAFVVAIENICAEMEYLSGFATNEVVRVPEGTPYTSFPEYFTNDVPDKALVLEGENLFYTPNGGGVWGYVPLVQHSNEIRYVAEQIPSSSFNSYFHDGAPPTKALVVEGNHLWWTGNGGLDWYQAGLNGNSFRTVPYGTYLGLNNYYINNLPDTHAFLTDGGTFWMTDAAGTPWDAYGVDSIDTVYDTLANIQALETAGQLIVGAAYVITDNTSADGGRIQFLAKTTDKIPSDVVYESGTIGNSNWPAQYDSSTGQITRMWDDKGNDVSGAAAVNAFQWGNTSWRDNKIANVVSWTDDGAVGEFASNVVLGVGSINTSGNTNSLARNSFINVGTVNLSGNTGSIKVCKFRGATTVDLSNNGSTFRRLDIGAVTTLSITGNTALVININSLDAASITVTNNSGTVASIFVGTDAVLSITGNQGTINDWRCEVDSNVSVTTSTSGSELKGCHFRCAAIVTFTNLQEWLLDNVEVNNSTLTVGGTDTGSMRFFRISGQSSYSASNQIELEAFSGEIASKSVFNADNIETANIEDLMAHGTSTIDMNTAFSVTADGIHMLGACLFNGIGAQGAVWNGCKAINGSSFVFPTGSGTVRACKATNASVLQGSTTNFQGSMEQSSVSGTGKINTDGALHAGVIDDCEVRCGHTGALRKFLGSSISRFRAAGTGATGYTGAGNVLDVRVND